MLSFSLIGASLVAVTVMMHAVGTTWWLRVLATRYADDDTPWSTARSLTIITTTVIVLITLHALQILVWAVAYLSLATVGELDNFESAIYFSFVTFTTLGYGDITLGAPWRVLSGIQALNGIMLVGWTTALLFAVVQRSWKGLRSVAPASKQNQS